MKTNHYYSLPEPLQSQDKVLFSSYSENVPQAVIGALGTIQGVGDKGASGAGEAKTDTFVPAGHSASSPISLPPSPKTMELTTKQLARREQNRRYRAKHPERVKELAKRNYQENKERMKSEARKRHIKRLYGITWEDYRNMWIQQQGRCAICNTYQTELKERLSVDHCHETGTVRGLLCQRCNASIGLFKEDLLVIQQAINYLTKWKSNAHLN